MAEFLEYLYELFYLFTQQVKHKPVCGHNPDDYGSE